MNGETKRARSTRCSHCDDIGHRCNACPHRDVSQHEARSRTEEGRYWMEIDRRNVKNDVVAAICRLPESARAKLLLEAYAMSCDVEHYQGDPHAFLADLAVLQRDLVNVEKIAGRAPSPLMQPATAWLASRVRA